MAQITSGIRSIFSHPIAYNTFQILVGASHARTTFVDDYLGIKDVSRLLGTSNGRSSW